MKILRIEGENIASLRGKFSVDFTKPPLATAGVFAISGPTGSGKSTLLDVMCLAIYGQTPRIVGKNKALLTIGEFSATESRSLLTRGLNHGFAKVIFETTKGTFSAEWRVEKATRKLKEGRNTKDHECHFYQVDPNGDYTEIDMRRKEPSEIAGLDFEQFSKTVLLAQGDFRKFLDSSGNERSLLLEKLTNTAHYADIGRRAFERAKKERETLSRLTDQTKGILLLSAEDLENKSQEQAGLSKALVQLRTQREDSLKATQWFEKEQLLRAEELSAKSQLSHAQGEWTALEPLAQDLADWDRTELLRETNEAWKRTKSDRKKCAEEAPRLEASWNEARQALEISNLEHLQLEKDLQEFGVLKSEKEALLQKASEFTSRLPHLEKFKSDNYHQRIGAQKALRTLRDQSRKSRRELAQALQLETDLNTWLGKAQGSTPGILDMLQSEYERLVANIESLQLFLKHQATMNHAKASLAQYSEPQKDIIAQLQNQLEMDIPCPVCGALEHPVSLHDPKAELERRKNLSKTIQTKIQEIRTKETQLTQIQSSLADKQKLTQSIQLQVIESWKQLGSLRIAGLENQEELSVCKSALHHLLGDQKAPQIQLQLQASEAKLKGRQQSCNANLLQATAQHAQSQNSLQNNQKQLDALTQTQGTQLAELQVIRETLGMDGPRANTILEYKQEWAQNTRKRLDTTRKTMDQLHGSLIIHASQITAHAQLKPSQESSHYVALLQGIDQTLEQTDRRERELSTELRTDSLARQRMGDLQSQIQIQTLISLRWGRLNDLIGQADGDLFRRYAQNITLQRLIQQANRHLEKLHNRYRLAPWANMEIVIIDQDMGNEKRSTRSLSGGEGFLVSMALALGLSDMASKQVRIGSLFIDEGFGTLDAETLQTVISVLEELRQEGRMVGIISHVDGLARQLGAEVQVKPMGDGCSIVRVLSGALTRE
jgi:exonuclease SbcC